MHLLHHINQNFWAYFWLHTGPILTLFCVIYRLPLRKSTRCMTQRYCYWYLIVCWTLLSFSPSFGQVRTFQQLEEKVYQFNNALKYNESQTLLLPVLQSETFSADEKYQAAILLSYTYKRVSDYQATLQFLETARQFARQTAKKDEYLATILGQEAFVYFDIHNYRKADSLMRSLEKTNFRHIDLEIKSKLVMQQGYLLFLAKRYPEAEATYDKAIGWLRVSSPCDLPMIYVKKMQLYAAMNRMDSLQVSLNQSTRSADSCAIIKYHIYAYGELLDIYKSRKDITGIAATTQKLDSLNKIYAQAENIAALHNQKETLLLGEKDRKLQREQSHRVYLTIGLWGAMLVVLSLLAWLLVYRRQKRVMEADFGRMKTELETYLAQSQTASFGKAAANGGETLSVLSERQREVLECMAAGLANREIAEKLFVSENTVKYHIKNIYQLLAIKDRKDLLINHRK